MLCRGLRSPDNNDEQAGNSDKLLILDKKPEGTKTPLENTEQLQTKPEVPEA
jgi:hypothetical protein